MSRPDWDNYFLGIALAISTRGSCARRKVGAVLTTADNRIIATGYNGPATGIPNCIETPCKGTGLPSGTGLDSCEALHAEQNALIYCQSPFLIHACYTTCSPCMSCVKMLAGTNCKRIVFNEEYPHKEAKDFWISLGREWLQISLDAEAKKVATIATIAHHPV